MELRPESTAFYLGRAFEKMLDESQDTPLWHLASFARAERERLVEILGEDLPLDDLRGRLCQGLRDREVALDTPGLADHLRATAVNQLAIDQPKYSGYQAAIAAHEASAAP